MADVRCPNCGRDNPDYLEECQFCQAKLPAHPSGGGAAGPEPAGSPDDWLRSLRAADSDDPPEEIPDWLSDFDEDLPEASEDEDAPFDDETREEAAPDSEAPTPSEQGLPYEGIESLFAEGEKGDIPDWLKTLGPVEESPPDAVGPGGWLNELSEPGESDRDLEQPGDLTDIPPAESVPEAEPSAEGEEEPFASTGAIELPDWLAAAGDLGEDSPVERIPEEEVPPADEPDSVLQSEQPASEEESAPEKEVPDWLEALEGDDEEQEEKELPGWLTRLAEEEAVESALQGEESFGTTEEIFEEDESPEEPALTAAAQDDEEPPWLSEFEELADSDGDLPVDAGGMQRIKPSAGETPSEEEAWVAGFVDSPEEQADLGEEDPDWLSGFVDEEDAVPSAPTAPPEPVDLSEEAADEVPGWLTEALGPVEIDETAFPEEEPLESDLEPESAEESPSSDEGLEPELEAWLSNYSLEEAPEPEEEEDSAETEMPEWLVDESAPLAAETSAGELPDWLQELQERTVTETGEFEFDSWRPDAGLETADEENAELEPEPEPVDWLPDEAEGLGLEALASGEGIEENLPEGDIPDWLKAMRPDDEPLPEAPEPAEVESGPVERVGPLAGMRGLLSAEPVAAKAGRPPAHFVRLQITDLQQRKADQLLKMVQAETAPVKPEHESSLSEQKVLRYIIAVVLFLVALVPFVLPGSLADLPAKPAEMDQLNTLISSLSGDSVVLVATDFQAGMSGEMDAASAAVFDHLMIQRPRLALVSTRATGPALGERLVQSVEYQHGYEYGAGYVNLGFLPGDSTGLRAFALAPRAATTLGYDGWPLWGLLDREGSNPWAQPALQGVNTLADFDMTVLVSDDPDAVRRWIEQVEPSLRPGTFVVIASAQAAPLVQPYTGLVDGPVAALVAGVPGGAAYEGFLQREGPARALWDGYELAGLIAVVLVLAAGSYNLYLAWKIREDKRLGRS